MPVSASRSNVDFPPPRRSMVTPLRARARLVGATPAARELASLLALADVASGLQPALRESVLDLGPPQIDETEGKAYGDADWS